MCALRRSPNFGGVDDPLETRSCPTYVAVQNFVSLGKTVSAWVGVPTFWKTLGTRRLGWKRDACPTCVTMSNSVILNQTVQA